jgi:Flp pilus assembly secretin CpaC
MAWCVEYRGAALRSLAASALIAGLCTLPGAPALHAADIGVVLDQARLLKLPDRVATVIIGNPAIADATVQGGNLLVITGKGYGVTNMIVLRGQGDNVIVVHRGVDQFTYSCTPICERRVTLGDSPTNFDAATGQTIARNGLAQGAAAPGGK